MRVRNLLMAATAAIGLYMTNANATGFSDLEDYQVTGSEPGIIGYDNTNPLNPIPIYGLVPVYGSPGIYIDQNNPFLTGHFDLVAGTPDAGYPNYLYPNGGDFFGYTKGDKIYSAVAEFTFEYANQDPYSVRVELGTPDPAFYEGTQSFADETAFYTASHELAGNIKYQLQQNGTLDFSVFATSGDLYLTHASLKIDTSAAYSAPDGGVTMGLLGIGCVGVVSLRKRLVS